MSRGIYVDEWQQHKMMSIATLHFEEYVYSQAVIKTNLTWVKDNYSVCVASTKLLNEWLVRIDRTYEVCAIWKISREFRP